MKNELVQIVMDVPKVSSWELAKWFWFNHKVYLKLIEKYKEELLEFWKLEEWKEKVYINKETSKNLPSANSVLELSRQKAFIYYLNKWQAMFLITLSNNRKPVVIFKNWKNIK